MIAAKLPLLEPAARGAAVNATTAAGTAASKTSTERGAEADGLRISRSSSWTSIMCKQAESFSIFTRTPKLSSTAFYKLTRHFIGSLGSWHINRQTRFARKLPREVRGVGVAGRSGVAARLRRAEPSRRPWLTSHGLSIYSLYSIYSIYYTADAVARRSNFLLQRPSRRSVEKDSNLHLEFGKTHVRLSTAAAQGGSTSGSTRFICTSSARHT